ncbi:MAG: hypothetical protein HY791_25290 [Deltaproteobacteria bacterium]|nr:hypothetical protein [Deltaproteobacteria bacterium]
MGVALTATPASADTEPPSIEQVGAATAATDAVEAIDGDVYGGIDFDAPDAAAPPELANPPKPESRRSEVIRAVLGLVAILVLAYLAGHPRVRELEQRLRISQVVTAGFPFVLLGLLGRHPSINVLSDATLREIRPLLPFGLGWIGFAIGFRLDVKAIDPLPRGAVSAVAFATAFPFLLIVSAATLVLFAGNGFEFDPDVLRAAMILGTAGAIATARPLGKEPERKTALLPIDRLTRLLQLEELAAVVGLILIAAVFRPSGSTGWQLPAVAWIFVTLGMGTAFGVVIFALLASSERSAETIVILLGSIAFTSGMASYLRLSPVVVCSLAGILLANFSGDWKSQVRRALARLEPPIYLVFLVIAGALWRVGDLEGWALMVVFVLARLGGRLLGVRLLGQKNVGELAPHEQRRLALAPMGALAVAVVVNAQDLYLEKTIPWLLTAILGGAVVSEVIVQTLGRKGVSSQASPPAGA